MSTAAPARAETVHDTLPAHHMSARNTEHRLRTESGQIEKGCLLHDLRIVRIQKSLDEGQGLLLQGWNLRDNLFRGIPGIRVLRRVVVADDLIFLCPCHTVREAPCDEERKCLLAVGRDGLLH